MGRFIGDLLGTIMSTFKVGKVKLETSAATAQRVVTFPDTDINLGTDFQANNANLTALAGLTLTNNKGLYATGAGAMATYDLTVYGRSLGAAVDAPTARTVLALSNSATIVASITAVASTIPLRDGSAVLQLGNVAAEYVVQAFSTNGGRFFLQKQASSSLSGNVAIDTLGTRFRVYEAGTGLGFYLDLAVGGASAGGQIWHSGNFTPGNYAPLASPVLTGTPQVKGSSSGAANIAFLEFRDSGGTRIGYVGDASAGDQDIRLLADLGNLRLTGGGVQAVLSSTGMTIGGEAVLLDNDTGWLTPTLLNGWTHFSGRPLRYRLEGDEVRFRGSTQNTFANNNTVAINAPSGFRPGQIVICPATGGAFGTTEAVVYCNNISTGALNANDSVTSSGTVTVCWDNVRYSVN